jgi:hypothetical protein
MKNDRPTRFAIRAKETPPELMDALADAYYGELSDEYLDWLQGDIDAKLGPRTFRSVSRAGW